jgi:hypothetical protein
MNARSAGNLSVAPRRRVGAAWDCLRAAEIAATKGTRVRVRTAGLASVRDVVDRTLGDPSRLIYASSTWLRAPHRGERALETG